MKSLAAKSLAEKKDYRLSEKRAIINMLVINKCEYKFQIFEYKF